jgi:hypothetical protein
MKPLAFAAGVLALAFTAGTPARADFAVVKFELGYCRIWWWSAAKPWGAGWTVVATAPDVSGAWAAQTAAYKKGKCK